MTWPAETVTNALALGDRGASPSEISRRIGVPRKTIAHWLNVKVPRGRLGVNDTCPECGHALHEPGDLPPSYVYLLGAYLGDGSIATHPRGVYRLRIVLDAAYPKIIAEVAAAMQAVRPRNAVARQTRHARDAEGVEYASCVEVNSYSRSWPCLFPQHGPGRKHERRIILTGWQQGLVARHPKLLLRGLIHSDGCRAINTGSGGWVNPRYMFTNVSEDIRGIFVETCGLLGLHTTFARPKTIYVSRKADVARMDEFVGPKA